MPGYMGRILRVNLSRPEISEETLDPKILRKFVGGRGLATKYLFDEVKPGIDPLGPENKLVFMTGPLTGTPTPTGGRYSVVSKSPLTGFWGHANSAGFWGSDFKRSGFDGVIFEGISPSPVYLVTEDGKAEMRDAGHLWGKSVLKTTRLIKAELGEKFNVACIGIAGENLVRYASIMNDLHRAAGRCGMGAVMGSKRLKAIAAWGKRRIEIANPEGFREIYGIALKRISESRLSVGLKKYGTAGVLDLINEGGGVPTKNWQTGVFPQADEINVSALNRKILVGTKGCFACTTGCTRATEVKTGPYAFRGEGPEYESIGGLGSMCMIDDIEAIAYGHYLCNEYGLDSISTGTTIAFAMECFEKGILTKSDTGGLELNFGDATVMVALIHKIAKREGIGHLLAEGVKRASERIGRGSERFAMHCKGLELPSYDPRAMRILGLGYATATRGGCHITSSPHGVPLADGYHSCLPKEDREPFDLLSEEPKRAKIVKILEDAYAVIDSLGACKFAAMVLRVDRWARLVSTVTGWEGFDESEFRRCGERIYNLERIFSVREGLTRADDSLPKRLTEEPLPEGPAKGSVVHLEPLLDAYYGYRGWDENGIPTPKKLRELEL